MWFHDHASGITRTNAYEGLRPLQAQSAFQSGHTVSCNRQFRLLSVLEASQHASAEHAVQFEQVIEIQDRTAMDANESCRVELLFKLGDCHVHDVTSLRR